MGLLFYRRGRGDRGADDARSSSIRLELALWAPKNLRTAIESDCLLCRGQRDCLPFADETEAILSWASSEFRLIYSALRQCGARPGELCKATIADVERSAAMITLKDHKTAWKTGQPRRIPIGQKLGQLLDQAIRSRLSGPVFLSPSATAWRVENLSRTYSRLRNQAGLPNDLVLYLARHVCGTKICRAKGIEYARRLLGHSNIATTQRYMHLDDKELAEA